MQKQRGGTFLGFVLGLVVGLGIALGVALYVTKVPLPFMSKGQTRSADQNDAETKKNKDWDPNALITGKPAPKATAPADAASSVVPPAPAPAPTPTPATPAATAPPPSPAADAIGALVNAKAASAAVPAGQTTYYVQVGAFRSSDDAQTQRAKLSLTGVEAAVTERDQGGRPIYRVRVGPFEKIEDAERAKEKFDKSGTDTVLVKVQR